MKRIVVGKGYRQEIDIPANEQAEIRARWAQWDNRPAEPPAVAVEARLAALEDRLAALEKRP